MKHKITDTEREKIITERFLKNKDLKQIHQELDISYSAVRTTCNAYESVAKEEFDEIRNNPEMWYKNRAAVEFAPRYLGKPLPFDLREKKKPFEAVNCRAPETAATLQTCINANADIIVSEVKTLEDIGNGIKCNTRKCGKGTP